MSLLMSGARFEENTMRPATGAGVPVSVGCVDARRCCRLNCGDYSYLYAVPLLDLNGAGHMLPRATRIFVGAQPAANLYREITAAPWRYLKAQQPVRRLRPCGVGWERLVVVADMVAQGWKNATFPNPVVLSKSIHVGNGGRMPLFRATGLGQRQEGHRHADMLRRPLYVVHSDAESETLASLDFRR